MDVELDMDSRLLQPTRGVDTAMKVTLRFTIPAFHDVQLRYDGAQYPMKGFHWTTHTKPADIEVDLNPRFWYALAFEEWSEADDRLIMGDRRSRAIQRHRNLAIPTGALTVYLITFEQVCNDLTHDGKVSVMGENGEWQPWRDYFTLAPM